MLETVREFGRMQLAGRRRGRQRPRRPAQLGRRLRVRPAGGHGSVGQFAAIDALSAEETNLADELRGAIADGDRGSLVQLLAALGLFWTMRGEHLRLVVLAGAVAEAVRGWLPPPDLADAARAAVAITLNNSMMIGGEADGPLMALLRQLGPDPGGNRTSRAWSGCCSRTTRPTGGSFPRRFRPTPPLGGSWVSGAARGARRRPRPAARRQPVARSRARERRRSSRRDRGRPARAGPRPRRGRPVVSRDAARPAGRADHARR
jgi:hypothetical protein